LAQTTGDPLALLAAGRARLAAGETINALAHQVRQDRRTDST
jgi:hypothetical protein